ncbi:Isopentenyl-diphosphate Delta-isomerase [Legionella busanensis]|uniref:Isopentenyl-diphosphate Delta-isomerase n=1 Tax=Legionella busanensis TaxID=190655 RepID=A0A378JI24_9GAMM|nr:isopentenyl-diphosphate Delta-isomerase [Legionella busanensis]STX50794.1 Isopentenyl-diphosphate Delta-isomerase [Legionella busanensis]
MAINILKSNVLLVNDQDKFIKIIDKLTAHKQGLLHRAYSIFVFRKNNNKVELLLQQRSKEKYHSKGLWTNTCCSHPVAEKELINQATARLYEEMGINIKLIEINSFRYFTKLDNEMFEHEVDHVLIGSWNEQEICPNPSEVMSYCWIDIATLIEKIKTKPELFTPWLFQALEIALNSNHFKKLMLPDK